MRLLEIIEKQFSNGLTSLAVRATKDTSPAEIVKALHLPPAQNVLLVFGGAGKMSADLFNKLAAVMEEIARVVQKLNTTVLDGGTDSGVMRLLGQALFEIGHTSPYIGVLPALAKLDEEGNIAESILEPHHSHFVLLDEDRWGDEVEMMEALATELAGENPSLAILINGGSIAYQEVLHSAQQGRVVLVLKGSGRLADEIATAVENVSMEERFRQLMETGNIRIVDMDSMLEELSTTLTHYLTEGEKHE
ncbi:MAG: hypothetical protein D6748_09965 [Calditrichaeota bacterium]|nr:MAG: hypothetical protein D6748_09965 [Calditrichota bacterium]